MKTIALIGCGNIGSRHLQSIAVIKNSVNIEIVEPNKDAIKLSKKRLNDINLNCNHKINWHKSINEISKNIDLAIVATNSKNRVDIVENLLDKKCSRFVLEKIVCQSRNEYDRLEKKINSNNAKAWVNVARRYYPHYKKIKDEIGNDNVKCMITAGDFGLGTNAIHFIDLFCWISSNNEINLDGRFLSNKISNSKRKGFKEFSGIINGKNKNSTFMINFVPESTLPLTVDIISTKKRFFIDEVNQSMVEWKKNSHKQSKIRNYLTSETTQKVIKDIFLKDDCDLPQINELYNAHKELFKIFNSHVKKIHKKGWKKCLIT
jgi:predicted dehydrogenase